MNLIISKSHKMLELNEITMIILSNLFILQMSKLRLREEKDSPRIPELKLEHQFLVSSSMIFVILQPNITKLPF